MNMPHLLVVIVGGGAHIRGSRFLDPTETARRTMKTPMRRRYLVGGIAAAAVLVGGGFVVDAASAGGGGGSGSLYGSAAPSATPSVARIGTAALAPGTALVDGSGRSLYLFEKDSPTMSACTGACTSVWPPVLAHGSATQASAAVQSALVGSVQRSAATARGTGPTTVTRCTAMPATTRRGRAAARGSTSSVPAGTSSPRVATRSTRTASLRFRSEVSGFAALRPGVRSSVPATGG